LKLLKEKKAEKELQMIFGLFILLIISLVVLSLFFKFTEKSSGQLAGAGEEWRKKAAIEKASQDCEILCNQIHDDNTLIEFCKTSYRVDWNKDNTIGGREDWGKWQFCEELIPCFVLVDNCQDGKYTGKKCRSVLKKERPDAYAKLSDAPATGLCGELDNDGAKVENGEPVLKDNGMYCDDIAKTNWRCRFGFYNRVS